MTRVTFWEAARTSSNVDTSQKEKGRTRLEFMPKDGLFAEELLNTKRGTEFILLTPAEYETLVGKFILKE